MTSSSPSKQTLEEYVRNLRSRHLVPIGILHFDVEAKQMNLDLFADVDLGEARALLDLLNIPLVERT